MRILYSTYCGRTGVIDYEDKKVLQKLGETKKQGTVKGLAFIDKQETEICYLHQDGDLVFTSLNQELKFNGVSLTTENETFTNRYNWNSLQIDRPNNRIYCSNLNGDIHAISYTISEDSYDLQSTKLFTHSVMGLNKILLTADKKALCLLSNKSNPALLDIETQSIIWRSKNVPRDHLDLEVPMND